MRKIIVLSMITLDGVMQAPGGPEEDPSGGFKYGGWTAPYSDEVSGRLLARQLAQTDYLLGRKTFDIFAAFWPSHTDFWPGINRGTKYVLSNTLEKSNWQHSVFLRSAADIESLKKTDGPDLQVHGSGMLVQLLLERDLVDELWLKIFPLALGQGKRFFAEGTIPAAFNLTECVSTPSGVIYSNYTRGGDVKTGTVGA